MTPNRDDNRGHERVDEGDARGGGGGREVTGRSGDDSFGREEEEDDEDSSARVMRVMRGGRVKAMAAMRGCEDQTRLHEGGRSEGRRVD